MSRDRCRPVEVDGGVVLVHGDRELSEQDRSALAEVVRAVKAKVEREGPKRCHHCGRALAMPGRYPRHATDEGTPGPNRCNPSESGQPYGLVAHPGERCPPWCPGSDPAAETQGGERR